MRVCYPFAGDSVGGAQMSTLSLIRALPPGIEPVIVVHQDGPLADLLTSEKMPFVRLPLARLAGREPSPFGQLCSLARAVFPLRRCLRAQRIDVLHTQDGRMHVSWWLAARLAGVPQVWHQRSPFSHSRLQSFMLRHVSAVVANSNAAQASLPAEARSRTVVIANPVDAPRTQLVSNRTDILKLASAPGDAAIVAAVGNLRAVKQPMLLAEAVVRASSLVARPIVLAVFGDDHEGYVPRMTETLKRASGRASLVHLGFRHPIDEWLKGCDALTATSNGDAFGRTLVEAMGAGVPVAAVDAGGHREIVSNEQNGLLVADNDADALARALSRLIGDEALRQRLIDSGLTSARDFAPSIHAEKIVAIYHALAA